MKKAKQPQLFWEQLTTKRHKTIPKLGVACLVFIQAIELCSNIELLRRDTGFLFWGSGGVQHFSETLYTVFQFGDQTKT